MLHVRQANLPTPQVTCQVTFKMTQMISHAYIRPRKPAWNFRNWGHANCFLQKTLSFWSSSSDSGLSENRYRNLMVYHNFPHWNCQRWHVGKSSSPTVFPTMNLHVPGFFHIFPWNSHQNLHCSLGISTSWWCCHSWFWALLIKAYLKRWFALDM